MHLTIIEKVLSELDEIKEQFKGLALCESDSPQTKMDKLLNRAELSGKMKGIQWLGNIINTNETTPSDKEITKP